LFRITVFVINLATFDREILATLAWRTLSRQRQQRLPVATAAAKRNHRALFQDGVSFCVFVAAAVIVVVFILWRWISEGCILWL